jgi:hypothetical protein
VLALQNRRSRLHNLDTHEGAKALRLLSCCSGLYRWEGKIKVRTGISDQGPEHSGGIHVHAQAGAHAWGQWLLGCYGGGSMRGLQCKANMTNFYEALMDIRHGPWRIDGCAITCAGGEVRSKHFGFLSIACAPNAWSVVVTRCAGAVWHGMV